MEYLSEMVWYASWPIVIYLGLKFTQLNLSHLKTMERHEELEALHSDQKHS